MRMLLAAALVAGTVAGLTTTANAAGGCGYGFHPTPYGRCVPNRGVVVVPRGRVCPYGFVWRYGRCRPI